MQVFDIPIDRGGRETTRHGTFDFPLALYTTRISRNVLGYINWHWHEEVQFCLVTEGQVTFRVGDSVVEAGPGEGIFVNSGRLHMARSAHGTDGVYRCLDVHPRLLGGFPGSAIQLEYVEPYVREGAPDSCALSRSVAWQAEALTHVEYVASLCDASAPDRLEVYLATLGLWNLFVRNLFLGAGEAEPPRRDESSGRVREMLRYVDEHYAEPVTLDDVARSCALSRSACCREFKRLMGTTVFGYLTDVRVSEAARMLSTGEESVAAVATACGFGSTSYFIKTFRERVGSSPGAYRRESRGLA